MEKLKLLTQALEKKPETNNIRFIISDPAATPIRPLEFVVDGMIAKGLITVIAGSPGSGKSFLVQYLLQTRNCNLLHVRDGFALYLTGADASETEIIHRAWKIKHAGSGKMNTIQIAEDDVLVLANNPVFMDALAEALIENMVDAIVFDTIRDYYDGDSKEAAVANATMVEFRKLAEKARVAVILITHTRKSAGDRAEIKIEDVADSRIFTSKADFVFGLQAEYRDDETTLVQITNLKTRSARPIAKLKYIVRDENSKVFFERSSEMFSFEQKQMQKSHEEQALIEKVKKLKASCMKVEDIAKEVGLSRQTVSKYLNR